MSTEVKKADCGHWVKVDHEVKFYVTEHVTVHSADGASLVPTEKPIVLCKSCEKDV